MLEDEELDEVVLEDEELDEVVLEDEELDDELLVLPAVFVAIILSHQNKVSNPLTVSYPSLLVLK